MVSEHGPLGKVWHDGDVIQTQMPYDELPITAVRIGGEWRPATPLPGEGNAQRFGDNTITEWIEGEDGVALVKVEQEHIFPIKSGTFEHYGECTLGCGVIYNPEEHL